jgi:hypothetical protein
VDRLLERLVANRPAALNQGTACALARRGRDRLGAGSGPSRKARP